MPASAAVTSHIQTKDLTQRAAKMRRASTRERGALQQLNGQTPLQRRRRQPNHTPRPTPASTAPTNFLRSEIGTKRVCWLLTSITPTGTARTPPPPPPPSPRVFVSPTPPVPAPAP